MELHNVIRGPDGVPSGWRLLKMGDNPLNYNGRDLVLRLTPEAVDCAMAYFAKKGQKIPLDSRHFVFYLAEKLKVDEAEVRRLMPDQPGTFGFGDLEGRPDGLWITNIEYVPLGRELMREKIFRYFSPGLRGLDPLTMTPHTGEIDPFRVTSCALENEPALNDITSLAASANDSECRVTLAAVNNSLRRLQMTKLEQALAKLLGRSSVALAATDAAATEEIASALEKLGKLLAAAREGLRLPADAAPDAVTSALAAALEKLGATDELLGKIKQALGLPADASADAVEGAVAGVKSGSEQTAALSARLRKLEDEKEADAVEKLIARGKAEGKLTEAQASDWAKSQTSAALAAFLKTAPVVVPLETLSEKPERPAAALSANAKTIFQNLGLTAEEQEKAKC